MVFAGITYFPSYGTHHILLANQLLMHFSPHLHQPKVRRGDHLYLQSFRTQQVKPTSTRLRECAGQRVGPAVQGHGGRWHVKHRQVVGVGKGQCWVHG